MDSLEKKIMEGKENKILELSFSILSNGNWLGFHNLMIDNFFVDVELENHWEK